jgi:hypothetical protein
VEEREAGSDRRIGVANPTAVGGGGNGRRRADFWQPGGAPVPLRTIDPRERKGKRSYTPPPLGPVRGMNRA